MPRKLVLLYVTLMFGSMCLSACNTMQGAGKDVKKAGEKVEDEAREHKTY